MFGESAPSVRRLRSVLREFFQWVIKWKNTMFS